MKKLINNKVIDINNIELFELAAEGLALQNTAVSTTADGIEANINSPLVRKYIKQYDIFFKAMPYPLYAIEDDIKYATLGNFIKYMSKEEIHMWVERGLHIRLDELTGMTLKIVNNTWSIVYNKDKKLDNTSMELFKESIGYDEYMWLLNKVKNRESTSTFYNDFMPEFIKACNGQTMVVKWELENMLSFGNIPNRQEFKQNRIINNEDGLEYSIDIYCSGLKDTDEKTTVWNFTGRGNMISSRYKQVKTYDFDSYSKPLTDKVDGKMEKCKLTGLNNLFMQLCAIKSANELNTFPNFEGVVSGRNLIFTIENRLYITKSNRLSEPKDIAHGVELYCVEDNKVYFIKSRRINDKISKDMLYSYNISDDKVRLCKIVFSY